MWARIKNLLKRFLPIPGRTFLEQMQIAFKTMNDMQINLFSMQEQINSLQTVTEQNDKEITKEIERLDENVERIQRGIASVLEGHSNNMLGHVKQIAEILIQQEQITQELYKTIDGKQDNFQKNLDLLKSEYLSLLNETSTETINQIVEVKSITNGLRNTTLELCNKTIEVHNTTKEVLWAEIFNNTINKSTWLHDKTFSPGRWAAGYPFLFVLYRILRDAKPKSILELGLGETTKVISQYANAHENTKHYVVEHNLDWIFFVDQHYKLSDNTDIIQLPWGYIPYKDDNAVRVYEGFYERFSDKSYDLICVDGPWGGDMEHYSRIDILSIIPQCLSESFIIIMDDTNRIVEQNTLKALTKKLKEHNIDYVQGIYSGQKNTSVICSKNYSFFISL